MNTLRKYTMGLVLLLLSLGAVAKDSVKILAIGNSFSQDAVEQYLWNIGVANGDTMLIGNMYVGGCTLERHYNNMTKSTAEYYYRKVDPKTGTKTETSGKTLDDALSDETWDYISLQQASGLSGQYDTYDPFLTQLIAYIKGKQPQSKIIFHQTWAYSQNSTHSAFPNYKSDQMVMYNAILSASKKAFEEHSMDLYIPSGTAVQNARTTFIGDNMNRDGYHLNVIHGRYTAACTWYESIFGKSVIGNTYTPAGLTTSFKKAVQAAAHAAVQNPYEVTDLSYIQNDAASTHYFVSPDGNGTCDGSSWNDAMSLNVLSQKIDSFECGNIFHFAGGKYIPTATLKTTNGYTFIGGYNPTLVGKDIPEVEYPSATPTIFSGDKNKNEVADEGDLSIVLFINTATSDGEKLKAIKVKGIDFTCSFDNTDSENHGTVLLRDCGYAEFDSCRFYGNKCTGKLGGMAITSQYSHLVAQDCQFFNNVCKSRGAAVRFSSNDKTKGYGLFDHCSIHDNKVTDGVGSAILVQHGKELHINNSTVTGNQSTTASGAIYTNGKGDFENKLYLENSVVKGNSMGSQIEMADKAQLYLTGSTILGDSINKAYNFKGTVYTFVSGGYNVSDADDKLTGWLSTDIIGKTDPDEPVVTDNETTTFEVCDSVLSHNPLQGWVIYAGLGDGLSDDFWAQYDNMKSGAGTVKVSDYATTLFIRAAWTYFNPEEDVYAWQSSCNTKPAQRLKMLIKGAKERNLRLAFSFITDSRDKHDQFTPQYVRDAGCQGFTTTTGSVDVWSPFPDDSVFQQKYEKFLTAFASQYNDPDQVQFISGTGLGKWGEGHSVKYSTGDLNPRKSVFNWITELNTRLFTKVPVVINFHRWILTNKEWQDEWTYDEDSESLLDSAVAKGFSLRHDALGMKHYYMQWEKDFVHKYTFKVLAIGEGGWVKSSHGNSPMTQDGYADYAAVRQGEFDDAQDAHMNMLDFRYNSTISEGETYSWFNDAFDLVNQFIREGGYHLYPAETIMPKNAKAENVVTLKSVWANSGWGFCPTNIPQWNQKYKVAYALLKDVQGVKEVQKVFVDEESDLSKIVKDNAQTFTSNVSLSGISDGSYTWAVGLVDVTKDNAIGLDVAVSADKKQNGWVILNPVSIGSTINCIDEVIQNTCKPIKRIIDGKLIIQKANQQFTAVGVEIK